MSETSEPLIDESMRSRMIKAGLSFEEPDHKEWNQMMYDTKKSQMAHLQQIEKTLELMVQVAQQRATLKDTRIKMVQEVKDWLVDQEAKKEITECEDIIRDFTQKIEQQQIRRTLLLQQRLKRPSDNVKDATVGLANPTTDSPGLATTTRLAESENPPKRLCVTH
jgi:hypothetical protein